MNIASILQEQAKQRPEAIAIIDMHRGSERHCTYAELAVDSSRTAALLHAQGIGKGDPVLVFQPMSRELYVVLLAIFRLGAVAMFLDPSAGRVHIDQCCEIGAPTALIAGTRAHMLRIVSASLRQIPKKFVIGRYAPGAKSIRQTGSLPPLDGIEICSENDPALLTFTSGSTGKPKAALRSHGFLMAQHRALEQALDLQPGDVDLTTLPVFLLANLASGLTSVIPDADLRFPGRIEAEPVVEQIERTGVTRSAGSPAFYRRVLDYCKNKGKRLDRMRRIDTGGAPVFPGFLDRLQRIAPDCRVVVVYGSTEAEPMAHIAWNEVRETDLQAMARGQGLLAGQPVPQVDLRVVRDQFGEPIGPFTLDEFAAASLPVDEIGEIVVTGDHVLKGYLQGEGDSETKFEVEGARWHRTGDAGFFDQQGRLWLVGRCSARIYDDKGLLYPFVVECAADFIQGVGRSAMVSYKGRRVLLLETRGSLDPDSIRERFAWAELDEVRAVDQIPMDKRHNAKVDYTRVYRLLD